MKLKKAMLILSCDINEYSENKLEVTKTLARLETGLQLSKSKGEGFFDYIIVSGGAVNARKGHPMPHAEVMKKWLVSNGVPESQILVDDTSLDTYQNIENSLYVLKNKIGLGSLSGVEFYLVTEKNHAKRAILTLEAWGIDPNKVIIVPVETYTISRLEYMVERCMYLLHQVDPKGKTLAKLNQLLRR